MIKFQKRVSKTRLTPSEKQILVEKYPITDTLIRRFIGAEEFINGDLRYCLWLKDVNPSIYREIPEIRDRLKLVQEIRSKSPTKSVQKDAERPFLFTQIRQPDTDYLVIPRHSSGQRKYVPFGFIDKTVIAGDAVSVIPTDDLLVFGIISSHLHMLWLDVVGGKLKSDYRYQPFVYNSFYVPTMTEEEKEKIRAAANNILQIRNNSNLTLEVLYDPLSMPEDLLKAHQALDKEIEKAYRKEPFENDDDRISFLFTEYQKTMGTSSTE